jgi:hypothetical protein
MTVWARARASLEQTARASSPGAQAERPYRGNMPAHGFDLVMPDKLALNGFARVEAHDTMGGAGA